MFFSDFGDRKGKGGGGRSKENLLIFGNERRRKGAELKVRPGLGSRTGVKCTSKLS